MENDLFYLFYWQFIIFLVIMIIYTLYAHIKFRIKNKRRK
jgi:hypothetical protein